MPTTKSLLLRLSITACFVGVASLPLSAQRQTVLKQIKVPHNYYFREMYLPQVTSGPSAVTWSPDGTELIYCMQGSLWRQRVGATDAVDLTSGAYDYQPDWSPDGRYVVYTSYRNDALELWVLDLTTGQAKAVVADGSVNLEPRWSPDGRRLAYVSTSFSGHWHIFVLPLDKGQAEGPAVRLTTDIDSHLPRYYYSVYDHYLSPTWSADGRALMVVSNRGHVWGSGGLWRMDARTGAELQPVHDEETTWKMRPDWSRDGKRVVYSSYVGRQWNQLWLIAAAGENPLQLTYGEFDNTEPRWSPDGRHIAYISNQGGNTSLWVLDLPGARRTKVDIRTRRYRESVGGIAITIVDAAGKRIAARVSVTGPDGRSFAPDDAWRHADDGFDRTERKYEVGYFHAEGTSRITLPAGPYTVEVSRGLEYQRAVQQVTIDANATVDLRVSLKRLIDLPAKGWYSGDLHTHMNYGGHYRNDPRHLALQARAEDVHVVENLIVNKEGRFPDISYFTGRPDPASTPSYLLVHDQEYHTSYWGHTGLLGLGDHIMLPGYAAYDNTAAASLYPTNATVHDLAAAQGGISGYVHPFESIPDPADQTAPLHDEFPVDIALGKVDYMEIVGFSDHLATAEVWYRALNAGFRIPAGAGTDFMGNFASLRGPVGLNRVFVKVNGELTHASFLTGLKAGRTIATNGPVLEFTLDGHGIGDEIRLPAGRHTLKARVTMRSIVLVEKAELICNGTVVATVPVGPNQPTSTSIDVPVDRSTWCAFRAYSPHSTYPTLDIYPFGTTSPIYIIVDGKPIRSAESARYFLAWIDRLEADAKADTRYNTEAERRIVLDQIGAARRIWAER